MKKKVIASGLIMTLLTGCQGHISSSIGIIGGADGTTAIYLTFDWTSLIIKIGIVLALILLFIFIKHRKK